MRSQKKEKEEEGDKNKRAKQTRNIKEDPSAESAITKNLFELFESFLLIFQTLVRDMFFIPPEGSQFLLRN